ncbi:MAG: glycerol kinase GlpK [Thermoguttaceae bacterium]|nr:glycerol kinase GlpK [Thermoguttaceae bacterium]
MPRYILTLDQGTTSSRAIVFDHHGDIVCFAQKPLTQYYPEPGWVEHDANEIWSAQLGTAVEALARGGISAADVAAVGIANQRETTILWNRQTGEPVHRAIVWQDRRTAAMCETYRAAGITQVVREKTGLIPDAYFSATKIRWILDHVPEAKRLADAGQLCFGTVDAWLLWKMSEGRVHRTDVTNASRTMLFNIHSQQWDEELLKIFGIPSSLLPEVCECCDDFAHVPARSLAGHRVPITGIAGDQQAAMFGQLCTQPGMIKTTYGTGCFMMMNTGTQAVRSSHQLLTTPAWKINGRMTYALEGSVFVGGAAVQWIRDGLGIIHSSAECEPLAATVPDNGGVYFVPALTGLGAPYWDPYARGAIVGLSRGSTAAHIARATLEGIAHQVCDVLEAMEKDCAKSPQEMRVDGGAVANNLLMQFQADIYRHRVVRPIIRETTALGAAYLAGLRVGFWSNIDEIAQQWQADRTFEPQMEPSLALQHRQAWLAAVTGCRASVL